MTASLCQKVLFIQIHKHNVREIVSLETIQESKTKCNRVEESKQRMNGGREQRETTRNEDMLIVARNDARGKVDKGDKVA